MQEDDECRMTSVGPSIWGRSWVPHVNKHHTRLGRQLSTRSVIISATLLCRNVIASSTCDNDFKCRLKSDKRSLLDQAG